MDQAGEESARREHYGARGELEPDLGHDADDAVAVEQQIVHRLLKDLEVGLVLQPAAYGASIQNAIGLRARGAHRRSLARVEDAKLDARLVRRRGHGAAQRVDFLDEMPLADAADRRVARHLPQGLDAVGEEQGAAAQPGAGERRLGAGVATTDNNYIIYINHLQ